MQENFAAFYYAFLCEIAVFEHLSHVSPLGLDVTVLIYVPKLATLHLPNVLIKSSVVTLVQILMLFYPFKELFLRKSSLFLIYLEMIKNYAC